MPKFRKKPVVIEAIQFTRDLVDDTSDVTRSCPGWFINALADRTIDMTSDGWYVQTLEAGVLAPKHKISWDDWIICGVQGEIYPCKPDIFLETYEPAETVQFVGRSD